jgi:hypothetical protein
MPTARTLCIAGGGAGAFAFGGGGGGAGGMRDENITLENLKSYDIIVGQGGQFNDNQEGPGDGRGESGDSGSDSRIIPAGQTEQVDSFSFSVPFDDTATKVIDVSNFSDADIIWLDFSVGDTDFEDNEYLSDFEIDGNSIVNNVLYGGTHYDEVTGIVGGKSSVTLSAFGRDTSPGVNLNFVTGNIIRSIGGGGGGRSGVDTDPTASGQSGGSGGGGGEAGDDAPGPGGWSAGSQGNDGGYGGSSGNGGGGGGADGSGQDGFDGGNGGNGASSNITGSSVTYAGGGASEGQSSGSGSDNPGGGGDASDQQGGESGEDGLVVIRYNPDNFIHEWTGGDNEYEVNGDKVIEFTSDGTLEPELTGGFFALD